MFLKHQLFKGSGFIRKSAFIKGKSKGCKSYFLQPFDFFSLIF